MRGMDVASPGTAIRFARSDSIFRACASTKQNGQKMWDGIAVDAMPIDAVIVNLISIVRSADSSRTWFHGSEDPFGRQAQAGDEPAEQKSSRNCS